MNIEIEDEHQLLDFCFKKAKELSNRVINEDYEDGTVGSNEAEQIEFNEYKFLVEVDVFWESSRHFDLSITGVNCEYKYYKCCNDF